MCKGIILRISMVCAHTLLAACSLGPVVDGNIGNATDAALPALDPTQVHYIAWVPRDQAQTGAVARALTHIAVGNAREKTGKDWCGGTWLLNGKITARV